VLGTGRIGSRISDLKSQIAGRAEALKSSAENLERSSLFHIFVLKFRIWNLRLEIAMKYNRFEELPVWKLAADLAAAMFEWTDHSSFRGKGDL
jgi:hypothetical protein